MEHGPFKDVPIETGDIPAIYVSLPEGKFLLQKLLGIGVCYSIYFLFFWRMLELTLS